MFIHNTCYTGNSSKGTNSQPAMEQGRIVSTFTALILQVHYFSVINQQSFLSLSVSQEFSRLFFKSREGKHAPFKDGILTQPWDHADRKTARCSFPICCQKKIDPHLAKKTPSKPSKIYFFHTEGREA